MSSEQVHREAGMRTSASAAGHRLTDLCNPSHVKEVQV